MSGASRPPRRSGEQTAAESSVRRIVRGANRLIALPLIALVRFYQIVISPLTPPTCRYYPSCSSYAVTALQRFGPLKGTWLAVRRVLRCHPWAPGGVDHVPRRTEQVHHSAAPTPASPGPVPDVSRVEADTSSPTHQTPARSSGRPNPRDKGLS